MTHNWKYLIGVLICFIYANVHAQTTISGTVFNEFGESISGANIYIYGTFDGTSSDQYGQYTFVTTSTDSVVLVASFMGY